MSLAAFYWWAAWGEGAGAYAVNVAAVCNTLLTLLLPIALFAGYWHLTKSRSVRYSPLYVYVAGWLLAVPFSLLLFPAHARHISPPQSVQDSAQALEQRFQTAAAPWEAGLTGQRQSGRFELLPAPKSVGYVPAHPWVAHWRSEYDDGSRAEVRFFLNGVDPPQLISASFSYPRQADTLLDAQALLHRIDIDPSTAPWNWTLPAPEQPPASLDATTATNDVLHIWARYPEQLSIRWTKRLLPDKTTEHLSYHAPPMPLHCRKSWLWLRVCLSAQSHNGVKPDIPRSASIQTAAPLG